VFDGSTNANFNTKYHKGMNFIKIASTCGLYASWVPYTDDLSHSNISSQGCWYVLSPIYFPMYFVWWL